MLDASEILGEAAAATGVVDSDVGVRGNLEHLVDSIRREFPLSEAGERRIHDNLLRDTAIRLESQRWMLEHPEIAAEPVAAPVFLMGLPRSGTTYFQYLFDRDHRFRLIRTWQSSAPNPPPGFDPASVQVRKAAWARARKPTFEGFDALHLYDEEGSDECHAFLEQSFGSAGLNNLYRVPTYFDYILDGLDLAETYRIHKRQLQLLQWKLESKPWALKYPNHVIALNEIQEVYPDARFVMTHRDPVQTLASISKMTFNLRSVCSPAKVDPHQVGRDMLHFIQRHIDRILAFDSGPHGSRVVHVDYYALIQDPVRELRSIHKGIGIDTPADVANAVGQWHIGNPKNARGRNDYALAHYGLDDGAVADQFGTYTRRFTVPRERDGLARAQLP